LHVPKRKVNKFRALGTIQKKLTNKVRKYIEMKMDNIMAAPSLLNGSIPWISTQIEYNRQK